MTTAINDATLKKAGDMFQYYIALRNCFNMNRGDKLQIEVNGDVSLISELSKKSYQMEVKHHIGEHSLADRNIDFWKTISNWYIDYDRISIFSNLILYTTSMIKNTSSFYNWNTKSVNEKLKVLIEIGEEVKSEEETFRKFYNKIFDRKKYDKKKLEKILEIFTIECSQNRIVGISDEFSCFVGHIPEINRDNYIAALLGNILKIVKDPPHRWELTREEFDNILQQVSPAYSDKREKPLPDEYSELEICTNEDELFKKNFVEEIRKIEYDEEIQEAVLDYWKTNMTIGKYFRDDFLYNKSLPEYRRTLSSILKRKKKPLVRLNKDRGRECEIEDSKNLYDEVMSWEAKDFGSIIKNQDYFQRGVIHMIVDEKDFNWDVGEKK